jgi:hypothetical protein
MGMEKYVLDANLFFNMEAGLGLGQKTEEVVVNMTAIGKKLKESKKGEFLMPPRVVDEFLSFFEDKNQAFIKDFLSTITIKAPEVDKVSFPAAVFYQLVEDIRGRSYRGLAIGEEEIKRAAQTMMGQPAADKKDFEIKTGAFIRSFRERYRHATRFGFLDSIADLDLIVLAKEQQGYLVSSDEGVIRWGRIFGVKETPVAVLRKQVDLLL